MDGQFPSAFVPDMFEADPAATYFLAQPPHISHDNQSSVNQQCSEYPVHFSDHWRNMNAQFQNNLSHQRQHTASVRSSQSSGSNFRSSNNSTFSQWHLRDSIASTNTTWSSYSDSSRDHYISQAERSLIAQSSTSYPQDAGISEEPITESQSKRVSQRQAPGQEKDQFSTCVSRAKRPRRSTKEPRYWCTSCQEGFGEKYDWKRHEETFQERPELYGCGLCNKSYFLDKDFILHHQKGHRCKRCAKDKHVELARQSRVVRTGWGCGFCYRFDSDWAERCKHIAGHFENGDTMAQWKHAKVIMSLLQQPIIQTAWMRLIEEKGELNPSFGWNQSDTGRAEGFPDSGRAAQLQDRLEFYTPDQSAEDLVRLAYEKGHRRQHKTSRSPEIMDWIPETTSQHNSPQRAVQQSYRQGSTPSQQLSQRVVSTGSSSARSIPREKELPPLPQDPPATLTGHGDIFAGANMQNPTIDFESWNRFSDSIPEDSVLPDAGPMDFSDFDIHFDPAVRHL